MFLLIGSKLLVDSLKREGTRSIFGIPGLYNMPMYDSLIEDIESGELRHMGLNDNDLKNYMVGVAAAWNEAGPCNIHVLSCNVMVLFIYAPTASKRSPTAMRLPL